MSNFDEKWRSEISDAQDYVDLNIDDIERVNQQWGQVSDYFDRGELDNISLINAVQAKLTTEQDESIRSLLHESKSIPYEAVVEYLREIELEIAAIKVEIENTENVVSERQQRLLQQKELLEKIAPSAAQVLHDATDVESKKITLSELEGLKTKLANMEAELQDATILFESVGRAWPLPVLADVHYEPDENEIFTVDQFPNEREQTNDAIKDRVERKFESRLTDASEFLAYLLVEKPGHIWTGEELGEVIYNDESTDERNSSRISALISNYRSGKVQTIADILGRELVLQRGKRQLFDARTGKSVPRTIKVVWRVVDTETARAAQAVTTLNSERTLRESYSEWEPTELTKFPLAVLPSGEYDGKSIVDAVPEHENDMDLQMKNGQTKEKIDWTIDFSKYVHETIEGLKLEGVMESREITWKNLRIMTKSTIVGTETARERAFSNKIIKRSETSEDTVISISQAVMSIMQNSYPGVFRASVRRREAFKIVDSIVEGYFHKRD